MGFKEEIAADAVRCFLDPNADTETVIYHTGGDTLNGRPVKAVVERYLDETALDAPNRTEIELHLFNDALLGVDRPEEGVDLVDVEPHVGDPRRRYLVEKILHADAGMWRVRCVGLGDV